MAFLDDIRQTQARLAAAQATAAAEMQQSIGQLRDVLFARLRPVAALQWASDVVLLEACLAFAASVIQGATGAVVPAAPATVPAAPATAP